jgi:hypothetical protein
VTDLSKLRAKEILTPEGLVEHERGMDFFYDELVMLNVNIYIINQIRQFPLDMFGSAHEDIFLPLVVRNFLDLGIVMITRIANDPDKDVFTLIGFKNRVHELIRPGYRKDFDTLLRQERFNATTKGMLRRCKELRNRFIAHSDEKAIFGEAATPALDLSESERLRDTLNSLLSALSFGVDHLMLPISYSEEVQYPKGIDNRSDIERLLDSIARDSPLLNQPEISPEFWEYQRNGMSEEQLKLINFYRKKFNLPEV